MRARTRLYASMRSPQMGACGCACSCSARARARAPPPPACMQMFSALKNIIIPPSSVNDPISNLIAACQRPCFAKATFSSAMDCVLHLACGFLPDQGSVRSVMVQRTVIPMGSFLLLTVLLFSSARGFLMNSSNWFRHSGTSGFMPPAGIALLITLSLGSYFVATFLLMTSSVPPEYRRAMLHAAGDVDVTVFARLNDVIFLVSSFATILGVLVRRHLPRAGAHTLAGAIAGCGSVLILVKPPVRLRSCAPFAGAHRVPTREYGDQSVAAGAHQSRLIPVAAEAFLPSSARVCLRASVFHLCVRFPIQLCAAALAANF
ncbi:hypothetical protein EON67_03390, partial [archaeon]